MKDSQLFTLLKAHPPPTTSWKTTTPPALKHTEKKQLRTEKGIKNHIKLSAMKRAGQLINNGKTLLMFTPFLEFRLKTHPQTHKVGRKNIVALAIIFLFQNGLFSRF